MNAIAIAVVPRIGITGAPSIVRGIRIVVACACICAPSHFIRIAYAIIVGIGEAVAIAIESRVGQLARTVFKIRFRVEVARRRVGATEDRA